MKRKPAARGLTLQVKPHDTLWWKWQIITDHNGERVAESEYSFTTKASAIMDGMRAFDALRAAA